MNGMVTNEQKGYDKDSVCISTSVCVGVAGSGRRMTGVGRTSRVVQDIRGGCLLQATEG